MIITLQSFNPLYYGLSSFQTPAAPKITEFMADPRITSLPIIPKTGRHLNTKDHPFDQPFQINCLPDSILIEILIRVPDCESAQQCNCVCKRWLSLISNPYFITRFIDHRRDSSSRRQPASKPFTLLHQYRYFAYHDIEPDPKAVITTHPVHTKVDAVNSRRNLDLGFLQFGQTADIVAACDDLVVCHDRWVSFELLQQGKGTSFHICNLLTKEWIALPPTLTSYWSSGLVGLLTYAADPRENGVKEFMYEYKLVHIPETKEFSAEIFSSETAEWSRSEALNPPRRDIREKSTTNAVTFRRKLHWIINNSEILAFYPFDCDNQCRLIDLPNLDNQTKGSDCLGVYQQNLRMSLLVCAGRTQRVIVWDLKDYDAGEWNLQHNVCLNDLVLMSDHLLDQQLKFDEGTCLLAFHPNDEEVLYLRHKNHILMCNVQERTLQMISECSKSGTWCLRNERDTAYILEQPCWPSPVRPLLSCTTSN